MMLQLVESMRIWENHCRVCQQCHRFYNTETSSTVEPGSACGVGRALILNIMKILNKGL